MTVVGRFLGSVLIDHPRAGFLFEEIGGKRLGFFRRAHRFILLIEDEAEQVGLLVIRSGRFLCRKINRLLSDLPGSGSS